MAVKVCGLAQKGNFVQKPSSRQRQHASVRIAESLARFLHCSAQPVAQTALRWWQQTRLLSKTAFVLATTNRAIARMLSNQARERVIVAIPHDRLLGEACCATQDGQYFCRYIACLVACRSARCFAIGAVIFAFGKRFQGPLLCPTLLFLKVRSSPLYARTYTYIHARTDSFIQEL